MCKTNAPKQLHIRKAKRIMSTATNGKRGRGLFFSSLKSFSLALGWDIETLEKQRDSRWEFVQLLDVFASKRVFCLYFLSLILNKAESVNLKVEKQNFTQCDIFRITGNNEIDPVEKVAKATGLDAEFVKTWGKEQLDIALQNLVKDNAQNGCIYIVHNAEHMLMRPTDINEDFGQIKSSFIEEYLK